MSAIVPAPKPARPVARPPAIALGVREAAAALSVSPRTVEALAKAGVLPSFTLGRRRLFAVEALRDWARRQGPGTKEGT